jgi:phospholipid transport system substrate-binding protein
MLAPLVALTLLAATPRPLEIVQSGYSDVQAVASAPGATVEQLAVAVDQFVDFEELARRALGETWGKITPAKRKEFTGAMRGMLRAFYAERTLGLSEAEVEYGQETVEGNDALVATVVKVKGSRIPIDYKLYEARKGRKVRGWRIYDIVTNKVSLLEDYRGQFQQLLATQGFDGLLATLKRRQDQVERSAAATQARDTARTGKKP